MNNTSLHLNTPLLNQLEMGKSVTNILSGPKVRIWTKLDCVQPSGSFKIRGIGLLAQQAQASGASLLCSSSGGNAGMATAYAASVLPGLQAKVIVPETTPQFARDKILALGAEVIEHGKVWDQADSYVKQLIQKEEKGKICYVPPFEHPVIMEGHSTLIDEIKIQFDQQNKQKPSAIVLSVGGGGLLAGVLLGLKKNNWESVPVIAVETYGAESFSLGMEKGQPTDLPGGITSIAKSLGAIKASSTAIQLSNAHPGGVYPVQVTDQAAVNACCSFADHQRCLVEPACGAALAAGAYDKEGVLKGLGKVLGNREEEFDVVVIACGGNIIDRRILETYRLYVEDQNKKQNNDQ